MTDHDDFPVEEVEDDKIKTLGLGPESEGEADEPPDMSSSEWSDYVLTHFNEEELVQSNPTADGLRRVGRKLLGDLIKSASKVIQSPNPANDFIAVCEHTLIIDDDGIIREFTEVGEVSEFNCDILYRNYATSTAATRAEARAWRKALGLRRVVAAEELTKDDIPKMPVESTKINENQKNFLDNICRRNNINVMKFIGLSKEKYTNVDDIPYGAAVKIAATLAKMQNNKTLIEKYGITGYDPKWRNK